MEPTIQCGQHLASHVNISGSKFHDADLFGAQGMTIDGLLITDLLKEHKGRIG